MESPRLLAFVFNDKTFLIFFCTVVGFVLRKDDAAALKNIIITIQSKAAVVDVSHFQDP